MAASTKLPIVLYNIPKSTKINLSKETVKTLAEIEKIAAIKDSAGEMENLKGYVDACQGTDTVSYTHLCEAIVNDVIAVSNNQRPSVVLEK